MAFKKSEKKEQTKHERNVWSTAKEILDTRKVIREGVTEYKLGAGCYMTLYEDIMRVQIDIFGFCFYCKVMEGKNGYFLSYPSVQNKDKEWIQQITCYDASFHNMMKELLAELAK